MATEYAVLTGPLEWVTSFVSMALWAKLALAALLGGLIGLEREYREKPAGLRTNILICLGAALFTHLSWFVSAWASPSIPVDASRIASQIVSGIGFLGAGAIIQSQAEVKGLTTAATIWVVAAVGMAVGAGAYSGAVAGTLLILLVLAGLGALERRVTMGWAELEVWVRLAEEDADLVSVEALLRDYGLRSTIKEVSREREGGAGQVHLNMKARRRDLQRLTKELFRLPEVTRIHPH